MNRTLFSELLLRISRHFQILDMDNINRDLANPCQKRVFFSYKSLLNKDIENVAHAQIQHINQMIHYLIQKDYCIDLCDCQDLTAFERHNGIKYDQILGFGPLYEKCCNEWTVKQKILFVTENNPAVVEEKYEERLRYFNKRHPHINTKKTIVRKGFYTLKQFEQSNYGIILNSEYNAESMLPYFSKYGRINANAIRNKSYVYNSQEILKVTSSVKKKFVWFGSGGFIHKGLDVLLDAFASLEDCELNVYGLYDEEKALFDKLKSPNTINRGRVSVMSDDFIKNVVLGNTYVIYPSCSEAMNTGVATCMAHGLIPIVTKECGFDCCEGMVVLDDYHVETIVDTIKELSKLSVEEIEKRRQYIYDYADKAFSLECFTTKFNTIMDSFIE